MNEDPNMRLNHILEAQQFNKKMLKELFTLADQMAVFAQGGGSDLLRNRILASLFFVPSNRTRFSFESAMIRLGGQILSSDRAEAFSSELDGGSLEDTITTLNYFADVIVLRHHLSGSAKRAARVSNVPIINAGDGTAQHPTQALLDLYTIERELGGVDGVVIAFVGDLANSRSVRSLCYFLAKYTGIKVHFVAPQPLGMRDDICQYLRNQGVTFMESYGPDPPLLDLARKVDVFYVTQIPVGSFGDRLDDYEASKRQFVIDRKVLKSMKKNSIIMHPLPRGPEIPPEMDKDLRTVYFKQIHYGLCIRMALLSAILKRVP
jgi:aspartate carbamoyltransferase catalytic subunit